MQAAGAALRMLQGKGREKLGTVPQSACVKRARGTVGTSGAGQSPFSLTREEILAWVKEEEGWKLDFLWEDADRVRREHVGDEVHLRGLIELSNYCRRDCLYCGIRASRRIERYRMTEDEVMDCARTAQKLGYGTVVLQSGEDLGLTSDFITALVRRIRTETPLAVTLSLGERSREELEQWRTAGADRYLLKHETSDPELFRRIHPDCGTEVSDRVALLKAAHEMGYEVGSGAMVGIPGQSYESLADDIMLFRDLDLEMIGCGPFVPHPDTPLGNPQSAICNLKSEMAGPRTQVPATDTMTTKVVALTRLVCSDANIPSTTALATVNREHGRELGLERGANVWMPNLTPLKYRALYEIYPGKAAVIDTAEQFHANLLATLQRIGRVPGKGPGGRARR
jgi:biotin synthase